jgi:hypothetical protein
MAFQPLSVPYNRWGGGVGGPGKNRPGERGRAASTERPELTQQTSPTNQRRLKYFGRPMSNRERNGDGGGDRVSTIYKRPYMWGGGVSLPRVP